MNEIKITDRDIHVLRSFGLTKKDISFLTRYMDNKDFLNFLNKLKRANALEYRYETKQKTAEQILKQKERNYQKECKCAVGAIIIDEMFRLGIIESYDDILVDNTNTLEDNVRIYVDGILNKED
ncbi:MAG: hypothetical protein LUG60_00270 [Erysipelotrichaceae bacterium]|nr:hypothetical protein [Erysipelotrichaceae bacterium]